MSPKTCFHIKLEVHIGMWIQGMLGVRAKRKCTDFEENGNSTGQCLSPWGSGDTLCLFQPSAWKPPQSLGFLARLTLHVLIPRPRTDGEQCENLRILSHQTAPRRPPGGPFPPRGVRKLLLFFLFKSELMPSPPQTGPPYFMSCLMDDTRIYSYSPFSWNYTLSWPHGCRPRS